MIFNEYLFGEMHYENTLIAGTAIYTVTITYTAGMSVLITADYVYSAPANTRVYSTVSFDAGLTWTDLICNSGTAQGYFDVETNGTQDMLFRITMETTDINNLPTVDSVSLTISQIATLYTVAWKVIKDKELAGGTYWIDPELHEFEIPYAWVDQKTHRDALWLAIQACSGRAYMNSSDLLRVEGPSYLMEHTLSVLTLTTDDYVDKRNPANYSGIVNYIDIPILPLIPAIFAEEVYRSATPETIAISQVKTLTVFYSKKPVIEAAASLTGYPAGTTITGETYYAWGAIIEVTGGGTAGTFTLLINGKPLEMKGSKKVPLSDDDSIRENGIKKYTFPDNAFVQTEETALLIAQKVLVLTKDARRDYECNWRGNPALELGDRITAPDSQTTTAEYWVTKLELTWDGALSGKITGRKAI